ncbi:MAG: hypothetical protein WD607_10585 [Candidatus Paceibacterota bacterium]
MTPEYREKAEKRITDYLSQSGISEIKNMQVEETFQEFDIEVHVWNVKTNQGAWWVVESEYLPMNLYTQDEFYFSADEAYSFHLGVTDRLEKRRINDFRHVLDELPVDIDKIKSINRSLSAAAKKIGDTNLSQEEIQSIGLSCRESLIELGRELTKNNFKLLEDNNLKAADFKGISKAVISKYAPGKKNKTIRTHARDLSEMAWDYSSEIVHSNSKNLADAKNCLLFTTATVSLFQNLFLKFIGFDNEPVCGQCNSKDIVIEIFSESQTVYTCNDCGSQEFELEEEFLK